MAANAPCPTASPIDDAPVPDLAVGALLTLCAAKLLLHLFTSVQHYGYFRDELYYLDMARHLDWGYVDAAPLGAVYAKVALWLGGSLAALRILPALAGSALIVLSILICRELGGDRWGQLLTGLAVLFAPGRLVTDSLMTMNAFEPIYWMCCVLVLTRILRTGNSRLWPWFGLFAGLGLENKHSTLFFGFAVMVALLLTPHRREFAKQWIWIAGAIAVTIFLPNLIWQVRHHFPTLEDLENVRREGKNVVLPLLAFLKEQILANGPAFLPVWLAGLVWLLWQRRWRVLGFTLLVFFLTMELEHAKDYYLFPIYPMVFAGGAVALERWLGPWPRLRVAISAAMVLVSLPLVPLSTWMLPPERVLAYQEFTGIKPPKAENRMQSLLIQPIADQFGWEEMTREVADIYSSLPPEERAKTGILTGNYGEAGAIDQFGPRYVLPHAWSRHQNYWFWGPPTQEYKNLIFLEFDLDTVRDNCTSYQAFPHYNHWGMGEENTPIYLCRGATFDLRKVWWRYHHWN